MRTIVIATTRLAQAAVLLLTAMHGAVADVEYRYSGNTFDLFSCAGAALCGTPDPAYTSYTTANSVEVVLTFDERLAPNLVLEDVRVLPGFSLSIEDGHQTLTNPDEVLLSTDADGNIIAPWSVISNGPAFPNNGVSTLNWPGGRGVADTGTLSAPNGSFPNTPRDMGQVGGAPATWVSPAAQSFDDVPPDYWAFPFIETLAASGITAGCGNNNFCPESTVTRAQMAVFLVRGIRGRNFTPAAATGTVFLDVAEADFAASYIEQLFLIAITGGCGNNNYCPDNPVTRDQMAVFLLRSKYGAGYSPPEPSGVLFNDVDASYWAAAWIEQLAAEGITAGCGSSDFCPESEVSRAQMAVFLVRTFGLGTPAYRIRELIAELRDMTFGVGLSSAELSELVGLLATMGAPFIVDEALVDDPTDIIRLAAIRALDQIGDATTLPNNIVTLLENQLGVESNLTVLGELQVLVAGVYAATLEQLSFGEAIADPLFAELVDLLVAIGENGIVVDGAWLSATDDTLVYAGVTALGAIESDTGLADNNTVVELETLRDSEGNQTIVNSVVVVLEQWYSRTLLEELGTLPAELAAGMQDAFDGQLFVDDPNELWVGFSARAAIASLYTGNIAATTGFLDFFQSQMSQPFVGFPHTFTAAGQPVGVGPGMWANVNVGIAILHYTAVTGDTSYLDMAREITDWLHNSNIFNSNLNLLAIELRAFHIDAIPSRSETFTDQAQEAMMLVDGLAQLLDRLNLNDQYPGWQSELQTFGDLLYQGISNYLWIDDSQYFVADGFFQDNGTSFQPRVQLANGIPLYESRTFSLGVLSDRPLPNNFDKTTLLQVAGYVGEDFNQDGLFGIDRTIRGNTQRSIAFAPEVAIPNITRTASLALAWRAVGEFDKWKFLSLEIASQAVSTGTGMSLLPEAVEPVNDPFTTQSFSGPEAPRTEPTAFGLMTIMGIDFYKIPTQEQVDRVNQ